MTGVVTARGWLRNRVRPCEYRGSQHPGKILIAAAQDQAGTEKSSRPHARKPQDRDAVDREAFTRGFDSRDLWFSEISAVVITNTPAPTLRSDSRLPQ
jgi:hypothetical protein